MKPLVSVVALLLGLGALVAVVTIQQNPYTFTRLNRTELSAEAGDWMPVRAVELPVTIEEAFPGSTTEIRLDDVRVEGSLRQIARPQAARTADEPTVEVTVIPAPCKDGEYRMIEENRGVRLMCPGGSL